MSDRKKYALRIALTPTNAVEGVTYMDLAAVLAEKKRGIEEYGDAIFDCVQEDESVVKVVIRAADIQMIMHNEFVKPVPSRIAVPQLAGIDAPGVPRPKIVQ